MCPGACHDQQIFPLASRLLAALAGAASTAMIDAMMVQTAATRATQGRRVRRRVIGDLLDRMVHGGQWCRRCSHPSMSPRRDPADLEQVLRLVAVPWPSART